MDDDFFPFYCLPYRGKSFHEICTTYGGADALTKIKTVLSNGIAKNYRKFCVDYAKRQRSRALLTNDTGLSGKTGVPLVFEPGVPP